jgi:hypothetical protein
MRNLLPDEIEALRWGRFRAATSHTYESLRVRLVSAATRAGSVLSGAEGAAVRLRLLPKGAAAVTARSGRSHSTDHDR